MPAWLPCAFPVAPIFLLPAWKFLGDNPCPIHLCTPSTVSTCSGHGTRWMFFRESINFYQLIPPYFFLCCLHNYNEIQILVRDSWFIACLVKVVSLRHSTSWWRNPMSLFSGVLAKEADPQHSFPKLGIGRLTRGEGRPLQTDICSNCYSSPRHTRNTSICPQINCETVFLNHRQVREPFPKSDLEEDLHLVSKIPLRPLNTPTMMCLCHREIRIFQLKASNTLLVEEQSGKKAYGIRLQQCIFFMSVFHTTT